MTLIPKMRKARAPKGLSLRLEALGVGDKAVFAESRAKVLATLIGREGWMNTRHPERRFYLGALGPRSTAIRRLDDLPAPEWAGVWAEGLALEAVAEEVGRPAWTYVPRTHGFAMWARERGLGVTDKEWWGWEHPRGWRAQRLVQRMLRKTGVPARTWK